MLRMILFVFLRFRYEEFYCFFLSFFIHDLFMIEFMMKFMISGPLGPGRARPSES